VSQSKQTPASNSQTAQQTDGDQQTQVKRERRPSNRNNRNNHATAFTTGDPEKDKRIKVIHKKLQDISKLKTRRDKGDLLEANQLSKINMEAELTKELSSLKLNA